MSGDGKEKVTLELPKVLLDWYRRIAESEGLELNEMIEQSLINDLQGRFNDTDEVAELMADQIVESGILVLLKTYGYEVGWLKSFAERLKAQGVEIKGLEGK